MNLTVDVVKNDEHYIVYLAGEIDVYTAPKLKETLLPYIRKYGSNIEVDLKRVNYMDSTGLGVFISALKASKEFNSGLKLVNLQERVYRLFKITGLNEIMDIDSMIRGGNI